MTRSTWVCWSITSETRIFHGSRVWRHGRSRRCWAPQSRTRNRKRRARPGASATTSVPDVVAVGALPGRGVGGLPDHELAAEVADFLAALVEALGLDRYDPAVVLGLGRGRVEYACLGVDGVAVER